VSCCFARHLPHLRHLVPQATAIARIVGISWCIVRLPGVVVSEHRQVGRDSSAPAKPRHCLSGTQARLSACAVAVTSLRCTDTLLFDNTGRSERVFRPFGCDGLSRCDVAPPREHPFEIACPREATDSSHGVLDICSPRVSVSSFGAASRSGHSCRVCVCTCRASTGHLVRACHSGL
jgi:hypothetical protein